MGYLRGGALSLLEPVLEHNRLGLMSLGVLTAVACQLVRDGATATATAEQALGLGRLYDRAGLHRPALGCYERAAGLHGDATLPARCTTDVPTRAEAWQRLLTLVNPPVRLWREAAVALAVHHEHRQRDLLTAQHLARRAFETEGHPRRRRSAEHRLRRLGRKIETARQMARARSGELALRLTDDA